MKKAVVIYNKTKKEATEFYLTTKKYFEENDIEILKPESIDKADFMVVIGGDGTLLGASKRVINIDIPVIAINLGSLGFLTEIKKEEAFDIYKKVLEDDYTCEERKFLEINIDNQKIYALNDVVLSKGGVNVRMVALNVYADDIYVSTYRADGIIVSSPTGSTAYSLSAGGPIIMPNLNAMSITPIAPHTLSARPLIMDGSKRITFEVVDKERELQLMIDGQRTFSIREENNVEITMSKLGIKLVKPEKRDYYSVLREKLKWGDKLC